MLRAKNRTTQFLAGFWFFSSPGAFRPDIRHWSDDLFQAAPQYEEYDNFLSQLDLSDDFESLEAEAQKRRDKIAKLDSLDKTGLSQGQVYHNDKQLVELLQQETSYLQFKAQREAYLKDGPWRRPLQAAAPQAEGAQAELQAMTLKTLEVTRSLVNNANFDGAENLALLVRLLGRTHNDNILLFSEQFRKKYPNSPLLAQVRHSLGEYYASVKDWEKAEVNLKAAMENKESSLRPYSIYKLGWVHILKVAAEKDAQKRAEGFKKASAAFRLSLKLMEDWKAYEPVFDLKQELLTDIAWMMAESRVAKAEAQKFFDEQDAEDAYRSYLSYRAVDAVRDGDISLAESSFAELLPLEGESRERPRLLLNISEMHLQAKNYQALVSSYQAFKDMFQAEHPWFKEWEDDAELQAVSLKQLGQHIAASASRSYQEAEKMPTPPATAPQTSPAAPAKASAVVPSLVTATQPLPEREMLFATSKELYRLYGAWYPDGAALQEAKFNEALTHFYTGDFEKSLELLGLIAADEKNSFRQQASYNAVLVAVNYDQQQPSVKLPPSGKAKAPVPFGKAKALLVDRIDKFLKLYPESDDRVTLQFMAAQNYYEYGHYPEAVARFDQLVLNAPETEQGESSLHTLLGYEVEAGMWTEVIARCQGYLKNKKITGAGHRKILRQTLEYAKGQVSAS